MQYLVIPLQPYPEQVMRVNLDGIATTIRVYYSGGAWSADIKNKIMNLAGVALVAGVDILGRYSYDGFGSMAMFDADSTEAGDEDPNFEGIGSRFMLVYAAL